MISGSLDPLLREPLSQLYGLLAGANVDYPAPGDIVQNMKQLPLLVVGMAHGKRQVGAREITVHELSLAHTQTVHNILRHIGRGRSRKRQNRHAGMHLAHDLYTQV